MPPSEFEALVAQMANERDLDPSDVLRKAVHLYETVREAEKTGKLLAIVERDMSVDTLIVGTV